MTQEIIIKKRDVGDVIRLLWENAKQWMPEMKFEYDPDEVRRFAEAGDCEFVAGRAVGVKVHRSSRGKLALECSTEYPEFMPETRVRELVTEYYSNRHRESC